jgi:hypothetical protein
MEPMHETREFLRGMGLPGGDAHDLPTSSRRFPDGAQYRIEIPSVEGPRCLDAVLDAGEKYSVSVHRVSQGTGSFLLTSNELDEMASAAAAAGVEVSLFARPSASWTTSASARTPGGAMLTGVAHGQEQVVHAIEDARRAAAHGIRSVLINDLGVLHVFARMREASLLPAAMRAKISVTFPVANPTTAWILERTGADTINIAADLSLAQIAAIRASVAVPLDIYVESPDSVGGFVRHYEIAELVRIAAPVYLKFGLRNAPDLYPSGTHLDDLAARLSSERVRRAALGLELLAQHMPDAVMSLPSPADLAIPVVAGGSWTQADLGRSELTPIGP